MPDTGAWLVRKGFRVGEATLGKGGCRCFSDLGGEEILLELGDLVEDKQLWP
jgi:hypothetical protein